MAYIAGKPAAFTSKDHNFLPGETVEKQIVVINNSRESVTCEAAWSLHLPQAVTGKHEVTVATGEQARIPIRFELPKVLAASSYEIHLIARFGTGETQEDRFVIDITPGHGAAMADKSDSPAGTAHQLGSEGHVTEHARQAQ